MSCPFSLTRIVRLRDDGSEIYHTEKDHCGRSPSPASADFGGGPRRNYYAFRDLEFLAEMPQPIAEKGEHRVLVVNA